MLGGTFDPSLMCVMGGALAVSLPLTQWALRRSKPLCNVCFELPSKTKLDSNLLLGAAIFGAGWGECRAGARGRRGAGGRCSADAALGSSWVLGLRAIACSTLR